MKTPILLATFLLALAPLLHADDRPVDPDGFTLLFNGKDLTGFEGDLQFWSVRDGAITGETTPEKKTTGTYLFIKDLLARDFEFRASFKIPTGNSGIQYRSQMLPGWQVKGYQADVDAGNKYTGILYEVGGRAIVAQRGQKLAIDKTGKKTVETFAKPDDLAKAIKMNDWNEYVILAEGHHLVHKINGQVMVDITDDQEGKLSESGVFAIQLHPGPPMIVQWKDLKIRMKQ